MTIYKERKRKPTKIQIDLMGPEGNIFSLIAYGMALCRKLKLGDLYLQSFLIGMKAGTYHESVKFFDDCFGEYCDLYGLDGEYEDEHEDEA